MSNQWTALLNLISERFNQSELNQLCFTLGIDPENLWGGESDKIQRIVKLILYTERHNYVPDLLNALHQEHPNVQWPSVNALPSNEIPAEWTAPPVVTLGPLQRHWAMMTAGVLLIFVIASVIISFAFGEAAGIAIGVIEPTATFTPTITPSPTATGIPPTTTSTPTTIPTQTNTPLPSTTPLAVDTRTPKETLIVIATFFTAPGMRDDLPHRKIRDAILEQSDEAGIDNLRVEILPDILTKDDRVLAENLGNLYDANMIIWGDQTGIEVFVNFLNLKESIGLYPDFHINETERTQAVAPPDVYSQFILEDLPNQMAFLSLYAVSETFGLQNKNEQSLVLIIGAIDALKDSSQLPDGIEKVYYNLGWLYQQTDPDKSDLAISAYNQALELNSDFVEAYTNRGVIYFNHKEYETAIENFTQAININPDFALAYTNRGAAYAGTEQLESALRDYNFAATLDPNHATTYYNRGNVHYDRGNFKDALEDYNQAIELNAEFAEAYVRRGATYDELARYKAAIDDYSQAIEINPNWATPFYNRGILYKNVLEDYDAAIADLNQVIKLDPNHALAYNNRGIAYLNQDKYAAAVTDFNKSIELDPGFHGAYNNLGIVYKEQGDYETAIIHYGQAITLDPNEAGIYNNRGIVYILLGEIRLAIEDPTKAIQLNPNRVDFYSNRGFALDEQGEYAAAIDDYNKAIELDPTYADAYNNRGSTYYSLGQYENSISDFTQAIELFPNHTKAYINRGVAFLRQGDYENAIADYTTAIQIDPDNTVAYYNSLCWDGSLFGIAIEVLEICEQAVEQASEANIPIHKDSRGLARALTGDFVGAIEDFKVFIEWTKENDLYEPDGAKRDDWIKQLEVGQNPFNEATLEELRNE